MATASTTVKPTQNAKENILGMTKSLEQRFGCVPRNDLGTTLNTLYSIQANRLPAHDPVVKYFTWGVGGRLNDTDNTTSAQYVRGTNMGLYAPRPFRAVPLEEDLSAAEMANYGLRQVTTIDGVRYCLYWAKKIDFTGSQVQYIRTDPVSGVATPYNIDYANLTPTPPIADSNGLITDIADSISVVLPGTLRITGQEVLESMGVMDNGDPRYAIVSEVGSVSASIETIQDVDFNNQPFSYQEAIMAQMVDHYTAVGQPFYATTDVWERQISYSIASLIKTG